MSAYVRYRFFLGHPVVKQIRYDMLADDKWYGGDIEIPTAYLLPGEATPTVYLLPGEATPTVYLLPGEATPTVAIYYLVKPQPREHYSK